ncbi:MAG: hypothetical protein IJ764_00600 [Bacteroidales bacterium]|nr:hypothetical protein [Bacteroidales bacterium]
MSSALPTVAWLAKNYECSVRLHNELEQIAAHNDSTARRLMRESEKNKKGFAINRKWECKG